MPALSYNLEIGLVRVTTEVKGLGRTPKEAGELPTPLGQYWYEAPIREGGSMSFDHYSWKRGSPQSYACN